MTENKKNNNWWRGGAIYQIYPRSFYDSNGDGIGDLQGITQKLDYVASLGVEAIWISPFFKSPMKDFGYDVSDFRDVDEIFGTMQDFDILLMKAHSLDLKVIIDLAISHTSDQHEWFRESCKSANNPKSDWYIWADPKPDGSPPNNWQSYFGGSAWTFNAQRSQYYLHNWLSEQPDLNYHNSDVQESTLNTMRFWLDKGVDGFRLDTVNYYFHDQQLRDNPVTPAEDQQSKTQYDGLWPYDMQDHVYDKSQPENIDFLKKIRAVCEEYDNKFLMGEISDDNPFELAANYSKGNNFLNTIYSTAMLIGQSNTVARENIIEPVNTERGVNGESWPCWAFSNHDAVRVVTRWGENNPKNNPQFAKMLIALLSSLRGTFCLYQGEELGLREAELKFEDLVDPWGIATWPEWQGRDGCRTPMPWNEYEPHAGFAREDVIPWLPVCRKHYPMAVRQQELERDSILNFTKDFLNWRKDKSVLRTGDIEFIDCGEDVVAFKRLDEEASYTCLFNLSQNNQEVTLKVEGNIAYSSGAEVSGSTISLSSFGFAILD